MDRDRIQNKIMVILSKLLLFHIVFHSKRSMRGVLVFVSGKFTHSESNRTTNSVTRKSDTQE